jgi:glycosyltransferase involved in cell wall biosynthesis
MRYGADPRKFLRLPVVKFIGSHHYTDPAARVFPSDALKAWGVPLGRDYLLYVGRLMDVKCPSDVLEAMRLALQEVPHAVGLLAGDGPLRAELQTRITEYGLTGRVFLLGNVDQHTLAALTTFCIILSPLTGMALIETSLAGAPVVAYDRDWQPEFITDGENGYLVPFRDFRAMARQAVLLLRDPDLRRRMGIAARKKALEFADQERHLARECAALDKVIQSAQRALEPRGG